MPFLATITEADALLIQGLNYRRQRGTISHFMQLPSIADGITHDEVILAIAATTITDPYYTATFLLQGSVTIQTVKSPPHLSPDLTISVVRAGTPLVKETPKIMREAVIYVESVMNIPLPTNHVILILSNAAVLKNYAGTNYGNAITYLTSGENGSDHQSASFRPGMVHEVAHYYWRGNEPWIDEGIATAIQSRYVTAARLPSHLGKVEQRGCTLTTLRELSELQPDQQYRQFQCNYYLGHRLFTDLLTQLGTRTFTESLGTLYHDTLALRDVYKTGGITQVQKAFGDTQGILLKHWTGKSN